MSVEVLPVDFYALDVFVPGHPAPQGSKKFKGFTPARIPILAEDSSRTKPWRADVGWQVSQVWKSAPLDGPVSVELEFVMPRPVSTPKRRTPPAIKKPDLDKLQRAVFDALTKVVWRDDSVITEVRASKRLAELTEQPGCWIRVRGTT